MQVILESKFNEGDIVSILGPCDSLRHQEVIDVCYDDWCKIFQYRLKNHDIWYDEDELKLDMD